jgi:hypothetical protein
VIAVPQSHQVRLAAEVANQAGAGSDIAGDFANFLIGKLPALAAEFAAARPAAAEPTMSGYLPAWMCDMAAGEILTTNDAMVVCGVETSEAVRQRCKRAEDAGSPIAIGLGGAWLISRRLLLTDIERTKGLPARLIAESRAKKLPKFGSNQITALAK